MEYIGVDYDPRNDEVKFIKSGKEQEGFFQSPLKEEEPTKPSIRKTPMKHTQSEKPIKSIWPEVKTTFKEKRKKVREYHDNFLPEETPTKTKTGLISIPKNNET